MRMSSLDREAEERIRSDAELRQRRPVLSTARTLSDQELLEKLRPVLGELDRQTFRKLCASYMSAEEMVEGHRNDGPGRFDADWPWLAATVIWERWAPDIPSFEIVDDAMQAGYHAPDTGKKCEIWLEVWGKVLVLADRRRVTRLRELDNLFAGTQCLFNWVQDLETELGNGRDVIQRFLSERRGFCEEYLARFGGQEPEIDKSMRVAIAEVYNQSGDLETVDRLYRQWLTADSSWGWGWIGWADGYWLFTPRERDFPRGEEILREGLAVAELRDREEVLLRLADLYAESGRPEQEREVREQAEALRRVTRRGETRYAWEGIPPSQAPQVEKRVVKEKIGRNAPCPCGSGKKYKKCCGRR